MQRVLIIIAAVTLVLLVSVAIVLATLDVNKYTPRIVAAVEQATGREFAIAGDIGLKPALIPTLSVRGVTFGNADWAAHKTMVSIERFEVQIRLLPILSGQIDIKRFVLIGVRVVLETDRKGRGNWLLDLEGASDGAATPGQAPIFDLQEVVIRDAVIEYRAFDADAVTLAIEELGFETERLGQPLQLDLDAQFNEQRFTARGTVAPLRRLARNEPFDIDLTLSVREIEFSVQGEIARPLDASGIDLTFAIALPSTLALADFIAGELPDFAPVRLSGKLSGGGKRYLVDDLNAVIGPSDVVGRVTVELDDNRPLIEANFESKLIDLSALPPAADSTTAQNTRVFSTDPLPLGALGQLDAKISLLVGRLQTAQVTLETLRATAELKRSKLSVDEFTATIAGGRVEAEVVLDAGRDVPRFEKTAHIDGMALAPFLGGGDVASGGIADLDVQISGEGASLAEIMGSADGYIKVDVGTLEISNKAAGIASADVLLKAFDILNPLSQTDDNTVIECAVINFPIKAGKMTAETGIGVSTRKLNILGGGTIDLKTEKIDIGVNPKPREGIGLNLASLAEFVRLGGTLAEPAPATDAKGVATVGLKVGAALATGGLSVVAEGLWDRAGGDVDVCAVARGDVELPETQSATAAQPSKFEQASDAAGQALKDAGSKVKGVFKGLFGD